MGREMDSKIDEVSLENRPGILMVGPSNVGKRTLLSRLLSVDFEDASDTSSEVQCYGWNINTKYYTADVSVWMAHLEEGFSISTLPFVNNLAALVMVFDLNDLSSFTTLQDWVSHTDLQRFDILLCIGNKADLLSGHFAHAEYRRHLQKRGERSSDPHPEFLDYGILESEGSSLLGDEEPSWDMRRSCLGWCSQYNIEYLEACASNAAFDKCLSVDGDSQGVERLYGALSAHMWPGMVLKSGDRISQPYTPEKDESSDSDEEPDYEIEYEVLSRGSAEPWDDAEEVWVSANGSTSAPITKEPVPETNSVQEQKLEEIRGDTCEVGASTSGDPAQSKSEKEEVEKSSESNEVPETNSVQEQKLEEIRGDTCEVGASTSGDPAQSKSEKEEVEKSSESNEVTELDAGTHLGFEDLEQLMNEIGNMRGSLRLMPDFQRRDMAAKLAMKMATMFGDSSGDEDGFV